VIDVDKKQRSRAELRRCLSMASPSWLHLAPVEDAGQRIHDRLIDEPALQGADDAQCDMGQDDGERQRS